MSDTSSVGYNPYRKQSRNKVDIALVAAAVLAVVVLVAWALLG